MELAYSTSPFRTQLGEFMLESDFTYLNSILPPMGEMGMDEFSGVVDGGDGVGLGAQGVYGMGFSG